jgi:hypothetical protein
MKRISVTVCALALSAAGVFAQSAETEVKSKITVKDGKSVTVTGCVATSTLGTGFVLTNVADNTGALHDYRLVASDADLSKHVGHRVLVSGKATDSNDAKVKIERKETVKVEHGDDKETHGEAEIKGNVEGVPYLGVKSMKMIAAVCP